MSTKRLKTGNLKVVCGRLYGTVSRGATKAVFVVIFFFRILFCFALLLLYIIKCMVWRLCMFYVNC